MAPHPGPMLGAYLALGHLVAPLAGPALRRRLARGKEDPDHWTEKLGKPTVPRPDGRLVWLHAVGLGEVMALRGLIGAMAALAPDLSFLVTSTARASGEVFRAALPARTQHQFLPLDLPGPTRAFPDHWRPDLSVWAEQDLWPGLVWRCLDCGIPVAMINGRMDAASHAKRSRVRGLYAPLLARMALVGAQDAETARHLTDLGATNVAVTGPLKAAAPPLPAEPQSLAALQARLSARDVWVLASSHPKDEGLALVAAQSLEPSSLLVIVPRDPRRGPQIALAARAMGLATTVSSRDGGPLGEEQVHVADHFGVLGLWYRIARVSLIGGTFCDIEGHNPWEAVHLGSAILHGPRTGNFRADFNALSDGGARLVQGASDIARALGTDLSAQAATALTIAADLSKSTTATAARLVALADRSRAR